MADPLHHAKRPVSLLAGTYGHPLHPILVTVPIGAWVTSLVFDAASHLVHQPGFLAQRSLWLIAIGVLGALTAACAGFLNLFAIPTGTRAFRTALVHMSLNLAVTAAYATAFVWRRGDYHHPAGVPVPKIVLSAACLAVLAVSGFLGGKLAYRYGVRVGNSYTTSMDATVGLELVDLLSACHTSGTWPRLRGESRITSPPIRPLAAASPRSRLVSVCS